MVMVAPDFSVELTVAGGLGRFDLSWALMAVVAKRKTPRIVMAEKIFMTTIFPKLLIGS